MNRREFITCAARAVAALPIAGKVSRSIAAREELLHTRLAVDLHRPRYHLLPPANWMNDPNGPIFWKGQYHMFYQYNPHGAFWGTMHWGHATSPDLVHWRHLPIALAPTPGGPDKDGCFSGCAVVNRGIPTLVYTGVSPEVQCLATSDDKMIAWTKYSGNPVIAAPPGGPEVAGFRDPCVWSEGATWYLALGSGYKGAGGQILLYRSNDLIHWDFLHPLCKGRRKEGAAGDEPVASGDMWECPDFFPLADKHVLLVSTEGLVFYSVGTYTNLWFRPEVQKAADLSDLFYAARTLVDRNGRRILWGWIREGRSEQAQRAAGWSGVLSLPRVVSLGADRRLRITPAPELEALRGKHHHFANLNVGPESENLLKGVRGDSLEVAAEFASAGGEECGLRVRCAPDGSEQTVISYNRAEGRLRVDREKSSRSSEAQRTSQEGRLELGADEPLKLRVFLDGSVVEVFANDRACLTTRIYPVHADSAGVGLFARGASVKLRALDAWEMRPISKDRLTT